MMVLQEVQESQQHQWDPVHHVSPETQDRSDDDDDDDE